MALLSDGFAIGALVGAVIGIGADELLRRPLRRLVRRTEPVLGGLDIAWVIEADPAKMPPGDLNFPVSFYFDAGFVPDEPPMSLTNWWSWAHDRNGRDVATTKVLVTLQGVEDVTVLVGTPQVQHTTSHCPPGVVCTPEGVGGGGVTPRQYRIDLNADSGPSIKYVDRAGRPPQFTLQRGDTEQIELIASALEGCHEWTCRLPVTVNGVVRDLIIDLKGRPFVTVALNDDCEQFMWADMAWT